MHYHGSNHEMLLRLAAWMGLPGAQGRLDAYLKAVGRWPKRVPQVDPCHGASSPGGSLRRF